MKKQIQQGFTLIELMIVVAIIGILAAVAIPQYQTYVAKSQFNRAVAETGAIKTAIEDCVLNGRTVIGTGAGQCDPQATGSNILVGASQVGATLPTGTGVPQVSTPLTGTGGDTITGTFGNSAALTLATESVTWTRDADGTWTCQASAGIDDKFVSNACPK